MSFEQERPWLRYVFFDHTKLSRVSLITALKPYAPAQAPILIDGRKCDLPESPSRVLFVAREPPHRTRVWIVECRLLELPERGYHGRTHRKTQPHDSASG